MTMTSGSSFMHGPGNSNSRFSIPLQFLMDIRRTFAIGLVDLDIGGFLRLHGMNPTTALPPRAIQHSPIAA
ncbi:MAG: hypothetical protein F4218_07560 [Synechococcus sp. SB0677_bin_5]|nr:hypothetical protein [Synechococcus sp. SB0677_bin_5]